MTTYNTLFAHGHDEIHAEYVTEMKGLRVWESDQRENVEAWDEVSLQTIRREYEARRNTIHEKYLALGLRGTLFS